MDTHCAEPGITRRQADVLLALLEGDRVPLVARRLELSIATARMHVRHLHERTSTQTLHGLVLWTLAHRECCVARLGKGDLSGAQTRAFPAAS
jgi:DNA-binding CsgD family transcriptional regulator